MRVAVLGCDPSLTATGWALGDLLGTAPNANAPTTDARLRAIHDQITLLAYPDPITLAVLEDLPTHGMGAGKTGMAQGVVRLALMEAGVPYVTVPPATLKKFACGKGNATKADMRLELFKRTGEDIRDDNQVDARWLMEMGLHWLGAPSIELPKTHTAALAAVRDWPAHLAAAS